MKTKRKNIFKSLLALTLALIMVLGVAPISELAGVDFASLFAPKAEALSADYNVGDIVKLGSYPQGRVTDSTLISALNKIAKTWTSYGYYSGNDNVGSMTKGDWMKYYDFTYNGVKYRAVTFSQYRPYYTHTSLSSGELHQKYNGYYTNNVYYFKFEPLKWRVLDPATGLVLCENIVDSQAYSNTVYEYGTDKNGTAYWNDSAHTHYANDYATSSIRKWLNNDFYNTAFSAAEKKSILTTTLDNRAYSTDHSEYDSETTKDKIFLLSYSDINNAAYGLSSRSNRLSKGSDYAKSQGLYVDSDGQSSMRLRSAGHDSYHTSRVSHDGDLNHYIKNDINFTTDGVRPALRTNFAVDIYNLGDETYSFNNFTDKDSAGHCFGMSITSSGYYIGALDRKIIGKDISRSLYSFEKKDVIKPICHYQRIQGSYSVRATVAGGSTYLTGKANISSDWNAVINYVKNHNYDNKGSLQIGFRKESEGGHAINFLYYKEVNGQQRIYAYDNNFPNIETYFYKGSNGKVYQAPQSTFSGSIDCIALRDVAKYYQFADKYDASRCIYAATGTVDVKDCVYKSQMEGTLGGVEYTMYELSDDAETTVVVPLTDDATFSYLNNDYSFGEINDETYGVLTLAQSGDSATGDKADFHIANAPVKATGITLAAPTSPIPVGGSYQLVAAAQPDGASLPDLVWASSDPSVASVDENGLVKALTVGTATISVTDTTSNLSAEVEIDTVQVIDFGDGGTTIKVGEKLIYTPVIQEDYVDYHYRWSSSDPSVVTVEPNEGELTGIKEGTATITMTLVDDDSNIIASSDFTVTVEKKDGFFKILFRIITAPFRAIINLFKKLFGK